MGSVAAWGNGVREGTREAVATFRQTPQLGNLVLANLLTTFTTGLLIPVLPLFFLSKGFSFFQIGSLFSVVAAISVGVQLLAGRNQAFFGRKSVLLTLLFVPVLAFPLYLFIDTPLQYLMVSAAATLAGSASSPGIMLLVSQVAAAQSRAKVFSYLGMAQSFAYAGAVILGGSLLAISYAAVFYVGSLLALASALVLTDFMLAQGRKARMRIDERALEPEERALLQETRKAASGLNGWYAGIYAARLRLFNHAPAPVWAVRNFRLAGLYLLLFTIALAIYPIYFPIHLVSVGLPPQYVGFVVAASWVTFGICQPVAARFADRTGRYREWIVASLVVAALLNVALAQGNLWLIITAWVLLGIADGVGRPITAALVVTAVPEAQRARAFGTTEAAQTAARVVAPFTIGLTAQQYGIPSALLLVAALVAISAIPIFFIRVSEPPRAPEPRPVPAGESA